MELPPAVFGNIQAPLMQRPALTKPAPWAPPIWKASDFLACEEVNLYPLTTPEMLALAYIKHKRDYVMRGGFSLLNNFAGRHRAGKSIFSACMGSLWDSDFLMNMEARIVQDHKEFLDLIERFDSHHIRGGVIMVDEAGVSMGSSDWFENWMKALTKTVQTFGYLHPVVNFVAPVRDFIDSRLRRMSHTYIEMSRYNNEYSVATPYDMKYSTIRNKYYYAKPIIKMDGRRIRLRRILFSMPPASFMERYANIEQARKPEMMASLRSDLAKSEIKKQKDEVDLEKVVAMVAKNYTLYESKRSKPDAIILDENKIEFGHKVPQRLAKYIKGQAEGLLKNAQHEVRAKIETLADDAKRKGKKPATNL